MQTVNFNYQELELFIDTVEVSLQKVIPAIKYNHLDTLTVYIEDEPLFDINYKDIIPLCNTPAATSLIYDLLYSRILDALEFRLMSKVPEYCYGINDPDLFCKQFQAFVLDARLPITVKGVITGYTWTVLLSIGLHHRTYTLDLGDSMRTRPSHIATEILINWILDELACNFEEERP